MATGRGISRIAMRLKENIEADGVIEEKQRKKERKKESDEAHATANKDQEEYDKQLLTLSSGFLAVSLAFIKDVVPLDKAAYLSLINASFILLGLCIFSVLFSYRLSIEAHLKAKAYWDAEENGHVEVKFPYIHAKVVRWINWLSGGLFFVGVAFTISFVILNLNREAQMTIANDGQIVKTPTSPNPKGSNLKTPPRPLPNNNKPVSGTGSGQSAQK